MWVKPTAGAVWHGATTMTRKDSKKNAPRRKPDPRPPVTWRFDDWAMI